MSDSAAQASRTRKVRAVLLWVLLLNWAVAVAKLVAGHLARSASVTADGVHSLIDGSSNVIGLVAMSFAARPADHDHPYGHGKFEALAALAVGGLIGVAVLELGRMAFAAIVEGQHPTHGTFMVLVMSVTLIINVAVSSVERRFGRALSSPLLLADARHTQSDVFVTLAVLSSVALTALGYPSADGYVALLVMVFIAFVAYGIVRQAIGILSDSARLDPHVVSRVALAIDGVHTVRDVRSRGMEQSVYVDLKIEVDPALPTATAHVVADGVERALFSAFPQVVDVVVHVEPAPTREELARS